MVHACLRIEGLHHRDGWHPDGEARPHLYILERAEDGALSLLDPPVPDGWWAGRDVAGALRALAEAAAQVAFPLPELTGRRVGAALCVEAYRASPAVAEGPAGRAYLDQIEAAAAAGELHRHPARVECRIVWCATTAAESVTVMRDRTGTRAGRVALCGDLGTVPELEALGAFIDMLDASPRCN